MGIYGAGKAFNLRYAQNTAVPTHCRVRQPMRGPGFPQTCCGNGFEQTTTVEVKNGPDGVWGWLLGGLTALGSLGGSSTQKSTQTSNTANTNQLKNLKTLGPEWKIVDNNDGTFTAAREGYEPKTGSYEDVRDHIISGNKVENQGTPTAADAGAGAGAAAADAGAGAADAGAEGAAAGTTDAGAAEGTGYNSPGKDNGWGAASADNMDGITIGVNDFAEGGGSSINGETKITTKGDASTSNYPKKITVKGYNYEFQEVKNGVALYKSLDGKGDVYRLEKNSDGSFALNQYSGDKGAGSVDITSKKANNKPI